LIKLIDTMVFALIGKFLLEQPLI